MSDEDKISGSLFLISRYVGIDGEHHKQWLLDQVVRMLTGEKYNEFVKEFNDYVDEDGYACSPWDVGIAP